MFRTLILGLFFALLCVTWSPLSATAQNGLWEKYMTAGRQALEQRDFPVVEMQFAAALREAERDGPDSPRDTVICYVYREPAGVIWEISVKNTFSHAGCGTVELFYSKSNHENFIY